MPRWTTCLVVSPLSWLTARERPILNAHRFASGPVSVQGMCAEVAGSVFFTPTEVLKQRMQIQQASDLVIYSSMRDAIRTVWRTDGLKVGFVLCVF